LLIKADRTTAAVERGVVGLYLMNQMTERIAKNLILSVFLHENA
jgi:hypothetical protein